MIALFAISVVYSIKYLRNPSEETDEYVVELVRTGIVFGILGCITGSMWASVTWGDAWPNDPKTNATAVAMLIYLAYMILRNSFQDNLQKARISAIYNIFAFAVLMTLAGAVLATIPLLVIFILAGRQLVSGIMAGAVKG